MSWNHYTSTYWKCEKNGKQQRLPEDILCKGERMNSEKMESESKMKMLAETKEMSFLF